jgi:hypothetical protein
MNYLKYLQAAGVPETLQQEALDYMERCERDYADAGIARATSSQPGRWSAGCC